MVIKKKEKKEEKIQHKGVTSPPPLFEVVV
jgi:hypothetical protein